MRETEVAAEIARLQERTTYLIQTDERLVQRMSHLEARVDANASRGHSLEHQISTIGQRLEWAATTLTSLQEQIGSQAQMLRLAKILLGLTLLAMALVGQVAGADRIGRALLGLL